LEPLAQFVESPFDIGRLTFGANVKNPVYNKKLNRIVIKRIKN